MGVQTQECCKWKIINDAMKCSSLKGMKVEALFLAFVSRVLEVGLRPRPVIKPEALEVECTCSCDCQPGSFGYLEVSFGALIGLILGALGFWIFSSRFLRHEPQLSPRRKGRGVIRHPGGNDSS